MLFIVNDFNCPSFVQYGQFLTMYWLKIKIINMLSCSVLRAFQVVGKRSRHKRSRVKYVTIRRIGCICIMGGVVYVYNTICT